MSVSKTKIAFFSDEYPPWSIGGAGIACKRAFEALKATGKVELSLFTFHATKEDVVEDHTYLFAKTQGLMAWVRRTRDILRALRLLQPDIVHLHHVTTHFGQVVSWFIARRYPTVITVHDATWISQDKPREVSSSGYFLSWIKLLALYRWRWNPFLRFLAVLVFSRARRILFVSDAIRKVYTRHLPSFLHERFFVLRNGLDLDVWSPRTVLPSSDQVIRIGFASRPTVDKGWSLYIDLLRLLRERGVKVRGHVIGGERVETEVKHLPSMLQSICIFDGMKTSEVEYRDWLVQMDLMFVGSRYVDPFPNVVIESLALGVPVVVGPYSGAKEIMDAEMGLVLEPCDLQQAASIVDKLTLDRSLYDTLLGWGTHIIQPEVRCRFDMKMHIEELNKIYRSLLLP